LELQTNPAPITVHSLEQYQEFREYESTKCNGRMGGREGPIVLKPVV